jgi:hypothetical protein
MMLLPAVLINFPNSNSNVCPIGEWSTNNSIFTLRKNIGEHIENGAGRKENAPKMIYEKR